MCSKKVLILEGRCEAQKEYLLHMLQAMSQGLDKYLTQHV